MLINNIPFKPQRYSSGEIKKFDDQLKNFLKYKDINILYNSDISLLELLMVIEYFKENGKVINLTLTYLPYQRMNHKSEETVKYVAKIFNGLELNSITILEPHCELNYLNNSSKISFVKLIFDKVANEINFDKKKDLLIFTDKGSKEKFGSLSKNSVYFKKTRDKVTGLINSYQLVGEIKTNQKLILVDDIISSGDTIVEALSHLKKLTKQKVTIITSHFENNIYNERLFKNKSVEKIYSSNSLRKNGNKKLKLYDIEEIYGKD